MNASKVCCDFQVSVLAAMNIDPRTTAAIAMTLCELATAKHSPPLECTALQAADGDASETVGVSACVE